jgi:carbonic anhydrase
MDVASAPCKAVNGRRSESRQGDGLEQAAQKGFSMEEAMQHAQAHQKATLTKTPIEVLKELQRGNARFWTGSARRPERSAFERRALISQQWPSVAVLGCSDSRVPVEIVFDQGLGDMFAIRVAGNCLDTSTLASLQYAVHHLKVKVVIVLGHEGCGAIKAACQSCEAISQHPTALGQLLMGLKEGLDEDRLNNVYDTRARDREAVVTNVQHQVSKLTEDTGIVDKIRKDELIVAGAFYEISSGIVDFLCDLKGESLRPESQPKRESTEAEDQSNMPQVAPGVAFKRRSSFRDCDGPPASIANYSAAAATAPGCRQGSFEGDAPTSAARPVPILKPVPPPGRPDESKQRKFPNLLEGQSPQSLEKPSALPPVTGTQTS